jgi:glycosyltransferase involved in cell wall biosynthesis
LRRASGVFISTPDLYEHVSTLRPDAVFLPNPIDARIFAPRSEGKHTSTRILINQALSALKAPEVAFAAAQRLKREHDNLEFYAFAHGPKLDQFRHCDEVQFIEPVPHARMPELINAFDIILGQFEIGSLGVSELESMACGKPVVSWVDLSNYSQWYSKPPPILSAHDTDAVVEAVSPLIQDREHRAELGSQARAWILEHHDYRKLAKRLVSYYRTLLDSAQTGSGQNRA